MTPPSSYRIFAALWLASLLIWWQALAATLSLALRRDAYTHILLILPVSVVLIVADWTRRKWKPSPNIGIGASLLIVALLIGVAGLEWGKVGTITGDVRLSLEMLALVTWWIGSFVCCFGTRVFRGSIFPLLFLLWVVPWPEVALNHVVSFLQQGTASFARLLLVMAGVPVAKDDLTLTVPGLTLQVAEECSSIRSSTMLLVSSMLLSYLLLRSFVGRAFVVLAAILLSIAKNGLRVFTLAVLGAYVDAGVLNSPLHHHGGVLFFAVALVAVLVLIGIVSWVEHLGGQSVVGKQVSLKPIS